MRRSPRRTAVTARIEEGHRLAVAGERGAALHAHRRGGACHLRPAQDYGRRAAAAPLKELGRGPGQRQDIVVKDGRFGLYVTDGETNASLRKADVVETITPSGRTNCLPSTVPGARSAHSQERGEEGGQEERHQKDRSEEDHRQEGRGEEELLTAHSAWASDDGLLDAAVRDDPDDRRRARRSRWPSRSPTGPPRR